MRFIKILLLAALILNINSFASLTRLKPLMQLARPLSTMPKKLIPKGTRNINIQAANDFLVEAATHSDTIEALLKSKIIKLELSPKEIFELTKNISTALSNEEKIKICERRVLCIAWLYLKKLNT